MIDFFFFFNDTATTEIYTLSLHDALPISPQAQRVGAVGVDLELDDLLVQAEHRARVLAGLPGPLGQHDEDRKSTRLNSSHANISYAVFCLKKKKKLLLILFIYYCTFYRLF